MPKGQTIINWTAENDAKLFLTVLAVQKIQVDYENVAKAFGPDVPGSCIQNRMKILRKRAASLGSTADSQLTTPSKRSRGDNISTSAKRVKPSQTDKSENIADKVTETHDQAITSIGTPKTPKTSTKARLSPRKNTKKEYATIADPFSTMNEIEDSNGDSFFDNDKSGSGDSADSAEDYKPKPKAELKIKSEF